MLIFPLSFCCATFLGKPSVLFLFHFPGSKPISDRSPGNTDMTRKGPEDVQCAVHSFSSPTATMRPALRLSSVIYCSSLES